MNPTSMSESTALESLHWGPQDSQRIYSNHVSPVRWIGTEGNVATALYKTSQCTCWYTKSVRSGTIRQIL